MEAEELDRRAQALLTDHSWPRRIFTQKPSLSKTAGAEWTVRFALDLADGLVLEHRTETGRMNGSYLIPLCSACPLGAHWVNRNGALYCSHCGGEMLTLLQDHPIIHLGHGFLLENNQGRLLDELQVVGCAVGMDPLEAVLFSTEVVEVFWGLRALAEKAATPDSRRGARKRVR